jgi:hypothetical protein
MASLTDSAELVGFFSYSREDDEDSNGALSALRDRIQRELRGQLGRTSKTFRLWQDKEAIAPGKLWEQEIKLAVAQAVFFIPIITPSVVRSEFCRFELEAFLSREAELGRADLVFPILYIRVAELDDAQRRMNDPVISIIAKRQWLDWRELRHRNVNSTEVMETVERFCAKICDTLTQTWLSPDERRAEAVLHEAEVRRKQGEAQARQREAESRAEEELERKAAAEKLAAERAAAAAHEERLKAAEARAEHDRKVALAAARAAEEARRIAENAAKDTHAYKEDVALRGAYPNKPSDAAPGATTEEQDKIKPLVGFTWGQKFDVKSWSYLKIAVVAALFGMFSFLIRQAHPFYVPFGPTYLLDLERVFYTASFFFLVAGLTNSPGHLKSFLYLLVLYCIETGLGWLSTLLGPTLGDALWMLVEWLVVAAAFLSFGDCLRDWKMLLIAVAVGACQSLCILAIRGMISPNMLASFFNQQVAYVSTALCLCYGIRRYQMRRGRAISPPAG